MALTLGLMRRRHEEWVVWLGATVISLGFFCLLTQMRERYAFPAVVFLALAAGGNPRLAPFLGLLSGTYLLNVVLAWPAWGAIAVQGTAWVLLGTAVAVANCSILVATAICLGTLKGALRHPPRLNLGAC